MHLASALPEILPHAVRVMAFFPAGQRASGKYRAFEYRVFLQANGAGAACRRAVSVLRSARDDPESLKKLGYPIKPSFYAVVGVCYVELPTGAAVPFEYR
jgi:hypothetical protein